MGPRTISLCVRPGPERGFPGIHNKRAGFGVVVSRSTIGATEPGAALHGIMGH